MSFNIFCYVYLLKLIVYCVLENIFIKNNLLKIISELNDVVVVILSQKEGYHAAHADHLRKSIYEQASALEKVRWIITNYLTVVYCENIFLKNILFSSFYVLGSTRNSIVSWIKYQRFLDNNFIIDSFVKYISKWTMVLLLFREYCNSIGEAVRCSWEIQCIFSKSYHYFFQK